MQYEGATRGDTDAGGLSGGDMSTSGLPWTYKNFCKMLGPETDAELNRIFTKALEEKDETEMETLTREEIKDWLRQEGCDGLDLSPGQPMCLAALALIEELEKAEAVAKCAVDVIAVGGLPYSNQKQDLLEAVCTWEEENV